MGEGSTQQIVGSAFDNTILWKMKGVFGVFGASHTACPVLFFLIICKNNKKSFLKNMHAPGARSMQEERSQPGI